MNQRVNKIVTRFFKAREGNYQTWDWNATILGAIATMSDQLAYNQAINQRA